MIVQTRASAGTLVPCAWSGITGGGSPFTGHTARANNDYKPLPGTTYRDQLGTRGDYGCDRMKRSPGIIATGCANSVGAAFLNPLIDRNSRVYMAKDQSEPS